jgi:peptidoglycan/xylan/chitin deacetylase (PgdA/CDA1 family)
VIPARRAARALEGAVRRYAPVGRSVAATTSGALVLTLDDGPDPVETPKVLATLEAHGATATFFVLLTRVRRHPELLEAVVAAGHEVALHGLDHRALTTFGAREAAARTRRGKAELEGAAGTPVRWFRPPYGAQTPVSWVAARSAGLVPVLWNGTTWDWKDVPDDERWAKAVESVGPGGILLAHDGIAGAADGVPAAHVPLVERARLLAQVLDVAGERGLVTRSLGAALEQARPVRTLSFTRVRRDREGRGEE